jgi:hypothetical protein
MAIPVLNQGNHWQSNGCSRKKRPSAGEHAFIRCEIVDEIGDEKFAADPRVESEDEDRQGDYVNAAGGHRILIMCRDI